MRCLQGNGRKRKWGCGVVIFKSGCRYVNINKSNSRYIDMIMPCNRDIEVSDTMAKDFKELKIQESLNDVSKGEKGKGK